MKINDFKKHHCPTHNNPGGPSLLPELPGLREKTCPLLALEQTHILLETKSEDSRKERKDLNSAIYKQKLISLKSAVLFS